jgi:hypothetical protein
MKKAIAVCVTLAVVLVVAAMATNNAVGTATQMTVNVEPKNIQNVMYNTQSREIAIMLKEKMNGADYLLIKNIEDAAAIELMKTLTNRIMRVYLTGNEIRDYGVYVEGR